MKKHNLFYKGPKEGGGDETEEEEQPATPESGAEATPDAEGGE